MTEQAATDDVGLADDDAHRAFFDLLMEERPVDKLAARTIDDAQEAQAA